LFKDALVLRGFNQPCEMSPDFFDPWRRLLQRLSNGVLGPLAWTPKAMPAFRLNAAARGIDRAP